MNPARTGWFHHKVILDYLCKVLSCRWSSWRMEERKCHLSSKRARTKSWGTTGLSTSPQSLRRWWKSVWKPFSKKKVIGSFKHRIMKVKSCLTSVMAFHNEAAGWWKREEKLLLSTLILVKLLTLSCHHHTPTDKLKVRKVVSEMNWKLRK